MRMEEFSGDLERRVLISMIVSRDVLVAIAPKWKGQMFQSPAANLIGSWCIKYFKKHQKAPGKGIETEFIVWSKQKERPDNTTEPLELLLSSLSDEYQRSANSINAARMIDIAADLFYSNQLVQHAEQISSFVQEGKLSEAGELARQFRAIKIGKREDTDIDDEEINRKAEPSFDDVVIQLPGARGKFFGSSLARGKFITVLAPEKRGKSYCLTDLAWTALLQRRKVLFIEAGDSSKEEVQRRFQVRAAKKPSLAETVEKPITLEVNAEGIAEVKAIQERFDDPLSWQEGLQAIKRALRNKVKSHESHFKLARYYAGSLTVEEVRSKMDELGGEGFIPDVVVIDYADLMHTSIRRTDKRDEINDIWIALRGISQEYNCLLLTATQANRASYKSGLIRMEHIGEDKRKLAHVTGAVGLNQRSEEKECGVMRLNWIVLRGAHYVDTRCCYLAQCLSLSQFAVLSAFAGGKDKRTASEQGK